MKDVVKCCPGCTLCLDLKVKVSFDRNVEVRRSELMLVIDRAVTAYLQELKNGSDV